jgi:cysteate synthase
MKHYSLRCEGCANLIGDDGYILYCPHCQESSLLKSYYRNRHFEPVRNEEGIYRYRNWLPINRMLRGSALPITFQSGSISDAAGLKNLWVSFSGYWPERGAFLPTGSFKELEAYSVLGRMPCGSNKVLTVASAGNTAAAFAFACSQNDIPTLIVIPEFAVSKMRFSFPLASCVKVIAVAAGDYSDAIRTAQSITRHEKFYPEGGVRNVARRDGLGAVLLNIYETIEKLPDYYFQAIGSGTGAIAVWDTAKKLSHTKTRVPHLYLSQNHPFDPIYRSWHSDFRQWLDIDKARAKQATSEIHAQVLANRHPPYAIRGGLREALAESGGTVFSITNEQALEAAALFEEREGIDIDPAAAVAFASLLFASRSGLIPTGATVALNITGGGARRFASDFSLVEHGPDRLLPVDAMELEIDEIAEMYR